MPCQTAILFSAALAAREKRIRAGFPSERQRFASALQKQQNRVKHEALDELKCIFPEEMWRSRTEREEVSALG